MPNRKAAFVVVLVFALGFAFYLFNKSKSIENKPGVSEKPRIYTNETVELRKKMLAEGFPEIPIYPGIKVDRSYKKLQNGKAEYTTIWIYDDKKDDVVTIIKWYVDEFKKAGWKVEGPYQIESENELGINAENDRYKLTLLNSEQYPGEYGVTKGEQKILLVDIVEK